VDAKMTGSVRSVSVPDLSSDGSLVPIAGRREDIEDELHAYTSHLRSNQEQIMDLLGKAVA
jgi:hypothetical protein